MRKKRTTKAEAARAAKDLLGLSVRTASKDAALASLQAELARKVLLRFNVRLGYSLKRFICHGCKRLIVPGVNARVRLGHGKPPALRITCLGCGHVNRKILKTT
ncbi:MAG: RNase P subunit [Nitrososphaerota archaeon]|nr:RNase P subunit [Nitrososphaerota archaeon]